MASPSVTYTFSNSTTADATQVNQNFTDIINALTDGTKDLSISALTCAGNATLNGNTTIGNASSDDLTITASLASTIAIKTTNTYDIGSSTKGLAGIYFGANSQTVRIIGSSSMSATWTLTLPVSAGTDRYLLQTNGSGVTGWFAPRVSASQASNIGLTATVAASALTVALKGADGNDPSSTNIVDVTFRNATAATGTPVNRTVTGALSVVVSSGSTLGHASGVARYIYVYLIDNAGTVELAVSSTFYDSGTVRSTTAEGGAGGADTNAAIYSTTARSNVPIRCIGRLKSTQATAGTWATAISEIAIGSEWNTLEHSEILLDTHAGFGSSSTKIPYFTNSSVTGTAMSLTTNNSTSGATITINEPGVYAMTYTSRYSAGSEEYPGISVNASSGATGLTSLATAQRVAIAGGVAVAATGNNIWTASITTKLSALDIVSPHHTIPTTPSTAAISNFRITKLTQNSIS